MNQTAKEEYLEPLYLVKLLDLNINSAYSLSGARENFLFPIEYRSSGGKYHPCIPFPYLNIVLFVEIFELNDSFPCS